VSAVVKNVVLDVYRIIFGILIIIAELRPLVISRYLLVWFSFMMYYIGLGFFYVFVGGFALGSNWSTARGRQRRPADALSGSLSADASVSLCAMQVRVCGDCRSGVCRLRLLLHGLLLHQPREEASGRSRTHRSVRCDVGRGAEQRQQTVAEAEEQLQTIADANTAQLMHQQLPRV
jgi:hypothetical protein